ncbi:MAG: hypothetical protein AAB394_02625 [Patescibacteria group bacterium]
MILTLPMTPRSEYQLGYWLTPVIGDILRKRTGQDFVISIGTLGMRNIDAVFIKNFIEEVSLLKLRCSFWEDTSNRGLLSDRIAEVLPLFRLHNQFVECWVCNCGALEIPKEQARFLKQKTFYISNGKVFCAKCKQEACLKILDRVSIFFPESQSQEILDNVAVLPGFYLNEFRELLVQFAENGICINRQRQTGFFYQQYNIDVEFVWETLLSLLAKKEEIVMVVNNHVLRQTLISILLFRFLGFTNKITLFITPYISYPGKPDKWQVKKLLELGHDENTVRFMLAASLCWREKDSGLYVDVSQVEYRRFSLLRKLTQQKILEKPVATLISDINHQNLLQGLKNVFNVQKFDYGKLSGLFS